MTADLTDPLAGVNLTSATVTVPAAPSATTDAAVRIKLLPDVADGAPPFIRLERIVAQGIIDTDLEITVDALDVDGLDVLLSPTLEARLPGFLGNRSQGVQVTIRNKRQAAVPVAFWVRGQLIDPPTTITLSGNAITTPLADVGGRPAYYDRNAVTLPEQYAGTHVGPHATTVRVTYTVAAGKKARIDFAQALIFRDGAASAAAQAYGEINEIPNGGTETALIQVVLYDVAVGAQNQQIVGSFGDLQAGDQILIKTTDLNADGTCEWLLTMKHTDYDG